MSRPEALFPLFADLQTLPGIGPKLARALGGLGVETPRDLLFVMPHGTVDRRVRSSLAGLEFPCVATVTIEVQGHAPPRRKGGAYRVSVRDADGPFSLVFFHARTDYLERILPEGARRVVSGKVELFDGFAQMTHPDHILTEEDARALPRFEPVYPLTAGVSQKVLARSIDAARARVPQMDEWIDPALAAREGWPAFVSALQAVHRPEDPAAAELARTRLAYDELLAHQTTLALARARHRTRPGRVTASTGTLRARVLAALPYAPTAAQTRAVEEIAADMASARRMSRLLQGDVGSGKTLVALLVLLIAVEAGGQGAMMAPTEILARQHLEALRPLLAPVGVRIELLTGRDKGAGRRAKLADVASGACQILVGTHALFQDDVAFADLRCVVIDEQHRFGVRQRLQLGRKGSAADVLVMTATPIPRSLALVSYGDMDVSVLDEKPPGRQPVTTALINLDRLAEVADRLRRAVAEGRQCYWVCPLVEESEDSDLTAAHSRFDWLSQALGPGVVGLVHGQLPPAEKDAAMAAFVAGQTRVLVATTVIEVGVNVPNATIMVIERAEAFGLAQLHQLRGRVGRGALRSTCLLLYQAPLGAAGRARLETLRETEDGFRIAEADLAQRGIGDLIGTAQSGVPRFQVADPDRHGDLMQTAQTDARRVLEGDPALQSPRGQAVRTLLWLMRQDEAFRLIDVG